MRLVYALYILAVVFLALSALCGYWATVVQQGLSETKTEKRLEEIKTLIGQARTAEGQEREDLLEQADDASQQWARELNESLPIRVAEKAEKTAQAKTLEARSDDQIQSIIQELCGRARLILKSAELQLGLPVTAEFADPLPIGTKHFLKIDFHDSRVWAFDVDRGRVGPIVHIYYSSSPDEYASAAGPGTTAHFMILASYSVIFDEQTGTVRQAIAMSHEDATFLDVEGLCPSDSNVVDSLETVLKAIIEAEAIERHGNRP